MKLWKCELFFILFVPPDKRRRNGGLHVRKGKRQQMNYDQKVLSEYEGKENGYTEEKFLNQENIKEEQHPMEK